jgi:hypothetical protein
VSETPTEVAGAAEPTATGASATDARGADAAAADGTAPDAGSGGAGGSETTSSEAGDDSTQPTPTYENAPIRTTAEDVPGFGPIHSLAALTLAVLAATWGRQHR